MAKKTLKDAAAAGTTVFDVIAAGNAATAQDAKDVQDVKNVKREQRMERLNLKIPAEIKEYLQAAAYRESSPTKTVSLTEYLCNLVKADMEKHQGE